MDFAAINRAKEHFGKLLEAQMKRRNLGRLRQRLSQAYS
jgi:hypothetical protein